MARPIREDIRQQTIAEIKATARQQMREKGTAGLSLRAIARQMGITAPAIYNYFPKMDDLITALIVDAFNALADAVEAAIDDAEDAGQPILKRMEAGFLAYRQWAVKNPTQFQLIYGNPIPGYEAPAEITRPLAIRSTSIFFQGMAEALDNGELRIPENYDDLPPELYEKLHHWKQSIGMDIPENFLCFGLLCWTRIHGIIMLELFNHLRDNMVDVDALYTMEVRHFLKALAR